MIVDFWQDFRRGELYCILSYGGVRDGKGKRYVAKPVVFEFEEVEIGADAEPTFSLGALHSSEFPSALMQGLIAYGIKAPENLEMKGKLEAQAERIKFLEELVRAHWGR